MKAASAMSLSSSSIFWVDKEGDSRGGSERGRWGGREYEGGKGGELERRWKMDRVTEAPGFGPKKRRKGSNKNCFVANVCRGVVRQMQLSLLLLLFLLLTLSLLLLLLLLSLLLSL